MGLELKEAAGRGHHVDFPNIGPGATVVLDSVSSRVVAVLVAVWMEETVLDVTHVAVFGRLALAARFLKCDLHMPLLLRFFNNPPSSTCGLGLRCQVSWCWAAAGPEQGPLNPGQGCTTGSLIRVWTNPEQG